MLTYHDPRYSAKQVAELLGVSVPKAAKLPLDWSVDTDKVRRCSGFDLLLHIRNIPKS